MFPNNKGPGVGQHRCLHGRLPWRRPSYRRRRRCRRRRRGPFLARGGENTEYTPKNIAFLVPSAFFLHPSKVGVSCFTCCHEQQNPNTASPRKLKFLTPAIETEMKGVDCCTAIPQTLSRRKGVLGGCCKSDLRKGSSMWRKLN